MMQAQSTIAHARPAVSAKLLATPVGLGMVFFLVSEAFLFGSLFIIYYYLRAHGHHWPPEGAEVHLTTAAVNTAILLTSSLTAYLAVLAIRQNNRSGLAFGLAATMVLGLAFLGIKLSEWSSNSFGPSDHAYGSIYYTLTGFHALHVVIGLVLFTALLIRALAGRFSAQRHLAIEVGSLYWHFVDVIWILVFTTIYLVR